MKRNREDAKLSGGYTALTVLRLITFYSQACWRICDFCYPKITGSIFSLFKFRAYSVRETWQIPDNLRMKAVVVDFLGGSAGVFAHLPPRCSHFLPFTYLLYREKQPKTKQNRWNYVLTTFCVIHIIYSSIEIFSPVTCNEQWQCGSLDRTLSSPSSRGEYTQIKPAGRDKRKLLCVCVCACVCVYVYGLLG